MGYSLRSTTRSSPALPIRGATTSSGTSPNCASPPPTTSRSSASHQEEGTRRRRSEVRREWDRSRRTGQGARLPLRCRGPRRPLRHLRLPPTPGTVFVGQTADTPAFALHREMVAHRGLQALSRGQRAVQITGRRRRQQQLHGARLEVQDLQQPLNRTACGDRGPLPAGHVEVSQSNTACSARSPNWAGRPLTLRDHPEIPRSRPHHRTARACTPGAKAYKTGVKITDARSYASTRRSMPKCELHLEPM